jgi:hypothetical protein
MENFGDFNWDAPSFLDIGLSLGAGLFSMFAPIVAWLIDKLAGPVVVAVVFTSLTNLWLERYKAERDFATKVADGLRDDLRTLRPMAQDYWSRSRAAGDDVVEAKITSSQTDILVALGFLKDELGMVVCESDDPLIVELLDSLTGGKFGNKKGRAADPQRVLRSGAAITALWDRIGRARVAHLKTSRLPNLRTMIP